MRPWGVLYRLYAQKGEYRRAYDAVAADIKEQGIHAQGSRLVAGLIAGAIAETKPARHLVEEVQAEHNSAATGLHMGAERDVILAHLSGSGRFPHEHAFVQQALSAKGGYYAWTSRADILCILGRPVFTRLREEYGRRIVASYDYALKDKNVPIEAIRAAVGSQPL
jgi:hypothetical protein